MSFTKFFLKDRKYHFFGEFLFSPVFRDLSRDRASFSSAFLSTSLFPSLLSIQLCQEILQDTQNMFFSSLRHNTREIPCWTFILNFFVRIEYLHGPLISTSSFPPNPTVYTQISFPVFSFRNSLSPPAEKEEGREEGIPPCPNKHSSNRYTHTHSIRNDTASRKMRETAS